jgi:spore maturation protein CgeB
MTQQQFKHDIGFIGTWRQEREAFLEQLADMDLCIWGSSYWKSRTRRNSPLRALWSGRSITGVEFARVCAENRIMLNIVDIATWPGPNMRAFEQPACGAFSLTTRSPALLEIFEEGESVECFDSVGEAREKIKYYIAHEGERRRIAEAGYRLVVNRGHTYLDRARQLLQWATDDRQ